MYSVIPVLITKNWSHTTCNEKKSIDFSNEFESSDK